MHDISWHEAMSVFTMLPSLSMTLCLFLPCPPVKPSTLPSKVKTWHLSPHHPAPQEAWYLKGQHLPPAMIYPQQKFYHCCLPLWSLPHHLALVSLITIPPVISCTAALHCNLWRYSLLVPSLPSVSPWYLKQFKNLLIMTWQNQWDTTNLVSFSTTITSTTSPRQFKFCFQVCLLICKIIYTYNFLQGNLSIDNFKPSLYSIWVVFT